MLRFTHRMDLALRLVDTTNGRVVSGRTTKLWIDGDRFPFRDSGGTLVIQNIGRESFRLDVEQTGYERETAQVELSALDKSLPQLELQLLPGEDYPIYRPLLRLDGQLPGMTALTAVRAEENACLIREFEPRKKLMTIFNPHKLSLERTHYALVDPELGTYEPFRIVKRVDDKTLKLDHALETEFKNYFSICPIVHGKVDENGNYRLRLQDDRTSALWYLRCETEGGPRFCTLDLHKEDPPEWREG